MGGPTATSSGSVGGSTSGIGTSGTHQQQHHRHHHHHHHHHGSGSSREEALRRMAKLVSSFMARNDSGPFREPVDWRGMELWDYPKVIKKMMDLGTIKRKLDNHKYATAYECAEDIRLVWTNCMTYNADGSDFFLLAESFSKRFEDRYRKIRAEFDTGEDDSRARRGGTGGDDDLTAGLDGTSNTSAAPPSLDVRTKFASNLFRLNGEELGYVLQMIDLRCPHAVESIRPSREEPEDYGDDVKREKDVEAEINVDAIDPKTFAELDRYIKERLYSRDAASSSSHHHHHHHHHHNTVKDGLSMTASATATTSGTTASQKRRKTK